MSNLKKAFIMNIVLFACEIIAIVWMMSGWIFTGSTAVLSAASVAMLRYFTVDSNILMGIVCLIAAIDQYAVLKGKRQDVRMSTRVLKLTGTVSVTLTMLVTVFFLTPTMAPRYGLFANFTNSNFFLHLLNPILAIIGFIGFEKTDKVSFRHTLTAIVPMVIYACYYVYETLAHTVDGKIMPGYDWYGFFVLGIGSAAVVLPLMVALTWGIAAAEWKLNRRHAS